jgi:hypothetical protein
VDRQWLDEDLFDAAPVHAHHRQSVALGYQYVTDVGHPAL